MLVFHEPMRWGRWLAALIGMGGVLLVAGPQLTGAGGWYTLVKLAPRPSSPHRSAGCGWCSPTGGAVICASALWIARREVRGGTPA